MGDVLILNANAQPVSYLPLSKRTWQDSMTLLCKGEAEVLHSYDDWDIHSPSMTMAVPSVIILKQQIKKFRTWVARDSSAQRELVFLRDLFVCQYCNDRFPLKTLTLDHVKPRKFGGKTNWSNLSSACKNRNAKRACNGAIQPRVKPFKPTYADLIKNMRKESITIPAIEWNYYLGWDEDKIRIVHPKHGRIYNDIFDTGPEFQLEDAA